MAYHNNNRNNKGGYYNNRNNNYSRPYNNKYNKNNNYSANRENEFTLDFFKNAKPDITIRDYRGVIYTIPGEFSVDFISYITSIFDKITEIENIIKTDNNKSYEKFPELTKLLKDFILTLINLNVDGIKYTIDDVSRGFNNIDAMMDIFNLVVNRTQKSLDNSKTIKTANNK